MKSEDIQYLGKIVIAMSYKKYLQLVQTAHKLGNRHCALCGKGFEQDRTKEHVPPRTLIADKCNIQFLTVPACFDCNNGSSKMDILFRNGLALTLFNQQNRTNSANKLIENWKTYLEKNNASLEYRETITNSLVPINVFAETRYGHLNVPIFDKRLAWPDEHQDPVIIKMVNGLYWLNHSGRHLLDSLNIGNQLFIYTISPSPSAYIKAQSEKHFVSMVLKDNQLIIRHSQSQDRDKDQEIGTPMSFWFHFYTTVKSDGKIRFDIGKHFFVMLYPKKMFDYLEKKDKEYDFLSATNGKGTAYKISDKLEWVKIQ